MDSYRKKPLTQQELDKWIKNKIYNPRTNRKIKQSGKIYKYLKKEMIHNKYKNESYNDFHGKKIDPILKIKLPIKRSKPLFQFDYQWDPFTGERVGKDPRGPLYFDPDTLIYFFYTNRLNHLWIEASNGYQGNYGDGLGKGYKFNIIGRGNHPEWYLFKIPLPDAYIDNNLFNQHVTFGPSLNFSEIKQIYILAQQYGNNYKKRFGSERPNLINLYHYYHNAIKKQDHNLINPELLPFLNQEEIKTNQEIFNRLNVDKLKNL